MGVGAWLEKQGVPTPSKSLAVASSAVAALRETVRAACPASRNAPAIVSATLRVLPV